MVLEPLKVRGPRRADEQGVERPGLRRPASLSRPEQIALCLDREDPVEELARGLLRVLATPNVLAAVAGCAACDLCHDCGIVALANCTGGASRKGGHVRVIAMTAFTRKEDRDRCLEAGMDAVVTKPIDLVELSGVPRSSEPLAPAWTQCSATTS